MTPRVDVSPERPNLDTVLHITVSGLPPGGPVTLRAIQSDAVGVRWASEAEFVADPAGTVDLVRDAPVGGSYAGVDAMGLIWSMRPVDGAASDAQGEPGDPLAPVATEVTAAAGTGAVGTGAVGTRTVLRRRIPEGLVRTEVRDDGLVGTMYHPEGATGLGAVLLLGGSEGGLHESGAALLAAHGYAVLALAVYGVPGRPPTMADIPVEYFGKGLMYLLDAPMVDPVRLTVIGGSKGGEAALLVGATYHEVTGVVSVVGSGVVTQGISQSVSTGSFLEIMRTPVPNWTVSGHPTPYVPNVVTPEFEKLVADGRPVPLRMAFEPGLALDVVADATISVAVINGPVLLLSAGDDGGYGPAYHQIAADQLAEQRRPHEHVVYPGAGHLIAAPPYAPTTVSTGPGPGMTFEYGGTPAATARARADVHRRILAFLAAQGSGEGRPGPLEWGPS